jgi:hypothetical protein
LGKTLQKGGFRAALFRCAPDDHVYYFNNTVRRVVMRAFIPFALIPLSACSQASADAAGSATFDARDFDSVALLGPDSVRVEPGSNFSVRATGPQSALDRLAIRVEQGTLKVDRKRDHGWSLNWRKENGQVKVVVTMPLIRRANLSGAGDLDLLAPTVGDRFTAGLSGAGNLSIMAAAARDIDISLSGSGDVTLKGKAAQLSASVSGSGNVDADALPVRTAQLNLSGVGNINARASDRVIGGLSGVGNIHVVGGARCDIRKSGVGDVSCAP